jgi:hypothetical protein
MFFVALKILLDVFKRLHFVNLLFQDMMDVFKCFWMYLNGCHFVEEASNVDVFFLG